jgi:predicted ATPase
VLREILSHKETRHELLTLLGRFLPFVSHMGVQNMVDRSVLLQLYERYLPDQPIPSMLLSDGTVQLVALIVALWVAPASRRSVVIVEEPDRNLHPHLIEQLVALFREISDRRQILFTTHNPEVVRHTPVENLLLVSRDKEGFSVISRPASNEQVQHFLKGEMGLDELFVENLLGA